MRIVKDNSHASSVQVESGHVCAWWSGGATSAIACYLMREKLTHILFIETGAHHPDTQRFLKDCETWYGKKIEILQSTKFSNHFDVMRKTRYINGPRGARCTTELKKKVRTQWEENNPGSHTYIWGFEAGAKEMQRAKRIEETLPQHKHVFPLIEAGLSKRDCLALLVKDGIALPAMYLLGFNNNNCIGCPKGGMAYWNMIRRQFPQVFEEMAKIEREVGNSCLRQCFLDELPEDAGRGGPPLIADCGAVGEGCEIEQSIIYHGRE